MKKEIRQFRKDDDLYNKASALAEKKQGFKLNMIQLIDMLLSLAINDKLPIKVVKTNFDYGKYTSVKFDTEKLKKVKTKILNQGFTAPFNFTINHLFFSYINNK